jgi:2-dehydro-3-deoxygluconokinase
MNDFDIISIGDVTLDAFVEPSESEAYCEIKSHEALICFSYGDKIPVKSLEFSVGGNAANNAVGTTRLGLNASLLTTVGADLVAGQIVEVLKTEGVDMSLTKRQSGSTTNYASIVNYAGERTIFSYHAPRQYRFPENLPSSDWVYLTSMGDEFKPFYDEFVFWAKNNPNVKVAFNPGSRQIKAGFEELKNVMEITHVIYVNRKEAQELTGFGESQGKEKDLLKALSQTGPKISIITDGSNGSYVFNGEKFFKAGVIPVDAHERTGAGDAFGSGCISALVKGKSFEEALMWGTANSASVIGYVGSQKGLLKEEGMRQWLERARSSEVEVGEF